MTVDSLRETKLLIKISFKLLFKGYLQVNSTIMASVKFPSVPSIPVFPLELLCGSLKAASG